METKDQEADTLSQTNSAPVQELCRDILKNAAQVTKYSNDLPNSGMDWNYFQSFPAFPSSMSHLSSRITEMMTKIYHHYDLTGRVHKLDVEEQVEMVSDNNDILMERINNALDEADGIKKKVETVVVEVAAKSLISGSWNKVGKSLSDSPTATYRLLSAKNILRPQLKFKDKIINKPVPFVPKIKEKPHSQKPLAILLEINDFGDEEYSHPYEFELEHFKPSDEFLQVSEGEITNFKKIEETPLVMVDTDEGLQTMLAHLCTQKEIAVDLEAHSYRSFQGITCLMQISTATADYIVDTFELWDNLQCLNEVFCNPKIVKIFHGADRDVDWLQRDFGLYVVNMFDTYQAAKLLNFSRLALAFLLQHYCDVVVNKEYQVADWRMRPLPQEMIDYARSDTHYLIYIYRRMKKDLLDRSIGNNLLVATWESSRHTCLKRYSIPKIGPDSHLELCRQSRRVFNNRQLYALKELFVWRDKVAREEDESVGFVLPKHMLLQIAEVLPREMQGILACCNPIPTLVRQHLLALHNIILKAREVPLAPLLENGGPLALPKPILASLDQDMEDPLHCIHDLTRSQDVRDDLPTLLGSPSALLTDVRLVSNTNGVRVSVTSKDVPAVQLFDGARKDADPSPSLAVTFETPYQRYTRTKAMEQATIRVEQKDTQERMENVYQHFRAIVNSSATDDQSAEGREEQIDDDRPTESAAPAEEKAKKKKPDSKNQPLSKQLPSKKRKKRNKAAGMASDGQQNKQVSQGTENETETTGTSATSQKKSGPKKKKLRSESAPSATDAPDNPAAPFTAFDYSQVNFQNFQRPKVQKHLQRGKRGGRGRHLGNKMMRNSGAKSMTYTNKK